MDHDYLKYYKIKDHDLILDMGATAGDFLIENIQELTLNTATLLCVEPGEWALQQLYSLVSKDNIKNHAEVIPGVISDRSGIAELILTDSAVLNHMSDVEQRWPHKEVGNIIVDSYTIQDIVNKYRKIDFIKCDVEGAEKFAFNTLTDTSLVDNMAIASYHIVDGEMTWKYLEKFFRNLGYYTKHEWTEGNDWSDMLYVSTEDIFKER